MNPFDLFGFATLLKGAMPEAVGKMIYQLFSKVFGNTIEEKTAKESEINKRLESDGSRIIDCLIELKEDGTKILDIINQAKVGSLKDSNGKKLSHRRFVYLLTLLEPGRLKDTLRTYNSMPKEKIIQFISILDNDFWGDTWQNFKNKLTEVWQIAAIMLANLNWKLFPAMKKLYKKAVKAGKVNLSHANDMTEQLINESKNKKFKIF